MLPILTPIMWIQIRRSIHIVEKGQAESGRNNTTVEYAGWTLVIIIGSRFVTLMFSTEGGLESSNKI
jgi:hypothetical protein